jgi:prefoldin subunit 5
MSEQLKEIQREIAVLRKDLERLRSLKADSDYAKKLRRNLIRIRCD